MKEEAITIRVASEQDAIVLRQWITKQEEDIARLVALLERAMDLLDQLAAKAKIS